MSKILPSRRYHRVPRPLMSDAYTVNGFTFETEVALKNSRYYATFRKHPSEHEPIYASDDKRILFAGLQALCDILFYDPITHEEINESLKFLKGRKATSQGFEDFEFPEAMWRSIVDDYGGYMPLKIEAMPEGSVIYPGEPFLTVSAPDGFGALVPWFESTLLHVWSASERLTAARHAHQWLYNLIRSVELPSVSNEQCDFFARLAIHDFGDRGASCPQESELVGKMHNLVFFGTDTFRAAYQNWKNGAPATHGSSVKALAHRVVQAFDNEFDCYQRMYDTANNNELLSMVGDCYDYANALVNKLIPLAIQSKNDGSGRVIVARPDSGDSYEMIKFTLDTADKAGLMTTVSTLRGDMKQSTTLRFIAGNGESYKTVVESTLKLLENGYIPWRCGIFGIGGALRNNITRDHMSTKFALCEVDSGEDARPVIKLSEEVGKQTLPGVCFPVRDKSVSDKPFIAHKRDNYKSAFVLYYNGSLEEPFGIGFTETFSAIEKRVMEDFKEASLTSGGITKNISDIRDSLISKHCPSFWSKSFSK